jgi:uncharacterized protein (DUF1015 family)
MKSPLYETEDYQGVRDVLGVIHDRKVIQKFIRKVHNQEIILADGHHRYQGSIEYMKKMRKQNMDHDGTEGYNYHLMYFTNSHSDDLRVLPTHRLILDWPPFNEEDILKKCEPYFFIKPVSNSYDIHEIILGKKWAFGLLFKENAFKIRLKPEMIDSMEWKFPEVIKNLDLTVLHYFFIQQVLGIPGKEQTKSPHVALEMNFESCEAKLLKGEASMALIVKEISMETIRTVCNSGYTLPQKSTFFYPKVICGFLFGSVKNDEFNFSLDPGF